MNSRTAAGVSRTRSRSRSSSGSSSFVGLLAELLAELLGGLRLADGDRLDHDGGGVDVEGQAQGAHAELLVHGGVQGGVVDGGHGRLRKGHPEPAGRLGEQLLELLGQERHLDLLQRHADQPAATAGLEEEGALPRRADGPGDEPLRRLESMHLVGHTVTLSGGAGHRAARRDEISHARHRPRAGRHSAGRARSPADGRVGGDRGALPSPPGALRRDQCGEVAAGVVEADEEGPQRGVADHRHRCRDRRRCAGTGPGADRARPRQWP